MNMKQKEHVLSINPVLPAVSTAPTLPCYPLCDGNPSGRLNTLQRLKKEWPFPDGCREHEHQQLCNSIARRTPGTRGT